MVATEVTLMRQIAYLVAQKQLDYMGTYLTAGARPILSCN
jgi:hypothetical protein